MRTPTQLSPGLGDINPEVLRTPRTPCTLPEVLPDTPHTGPDLHISPDCYRDSALDFNSHFNFTFNFDPGYADPDSSDDHDANLQSGNAGRVGQKVSRGRTIEGCTIGGDTIEGRTIKGRTNGGRTRGGRVGRGRVKTTGRGKDRGGGGNPRSAPKRNEKVPAAMSAWGLLGPPSLEFDGRSNNNSGDEDSQEQEERSQSQTTLGYMENLPFSAKETYNVLARTEQFFMKISAVARQLLLGSDDHHHLFRPLFQPSDPRSHTLLQDDSLENVARNCASILSSRSAFDFAYMLQSIHFNAKVRQ